MRLAAERRRHANCSIPHLFICRSVFASTPALPQEVQPVKKLTIIGKLTRVMAIGGESTGWSLE